MLERNHHSLPEEKKLKKKCPDKTRPLCGSSMFIFGPVDAGVVRLAMARCEGRKSNQACGAQQRKVHQKYNNKLCWI
jgi:hypothetical protein